MHLKEAAAAVVRLLRSDDRAALMTFTGAVRLRTPWTSDRAVLEAGIAATEAAGATSLHDAAYAALTLRDPQQGRPLVLVFSDGDDTTSWLPGQNVIDIAKRNDAVVYAVSLVSTPATPPANRTATKVKSMEMELRPGYRLDFHSGIQDKIKDAPEVTLLETLLEALADQTGGKVVHAESSDRLRERRSCR